MRRWALIVAAVLLIQASPAPVRAHGSAGPPPPDDIIWRLLQDQPQGVREQGSALFETWMTFDIPHLAVLRAMEDPCGHVTCEPFSESQARLLWQLAMDQKNFDEQADYTLWALLVAIGGFVISIVSLFFSLRDQRKKAS